jgi:hypothetical protein
VPTRALKRIVRSADSLRMQSDIETAIKRAGLKLGGGLLLLCALIGIRIVTATPAGIESEIAELEESGAALAEVDAHAADPSSDVATGDAGTRGSLVPDRGPRGRSSSSASGAAARDAERLVSCEIRGSVHFMRAADCATRGGRAADLD